MNQLSTGWPIEIKVTDYKCFGNLPVGFEELKPINLVVGRNNTGKSALVDVLQEACKEGPNLSVRAEKKPQNPIFYFSAVIPEAALSATFPGGSPGEAHYRGARLSWIQPNGQAPSSRQSRGLVPPRGNIANIGDQAAAETNLARGIRLPITGLHVRRMAAERDMGPESEVDAVDVQPSGAGATNLIRAIYTRIGYEREIITEQLLQALNEVVMPDYEFTEILVRRSPNGMWEVELREKVKGSIPVSRSGSGIKTVLIALCNLVVLPAQQDQPLDKYLFAFEELENSLHPALQRRLLTYATERVVDSGSTILLTTHSSVAIDMFQSNSNAQILHVTHKDTTTAVNVVSTYAHGRSILDDLDVRASDLLQSNGIVWVEGPSDRIYLNHWIRMWTDNCIREGTHYQAVYYGGSLLAHLTASPPGEMDADKLAILRINKNAAILMDSDRSAESVPISATKSRMAKEITAMEGYVWVTAGREIENYVPPEAIAKALGLSEPPDIGQFADIRDSLEKSEVGLGDKFERSKAVHATRFLEHVDVALQRTRLDWARHIDAITKVICNWNRLDPQTIFKNGGDRMSF